MADDDLTRLTDDEKVALVALLKRTIDGDRYPLSPRIGMLRGILAKLEDPKPAPAPLPPRRHYAPPRAHRKAAESARLRHDQAMHLPRLRGRDREAIDRRVDVVSSFTVRFARRPLLSSAQRGDSNHHR